MSTARLPLYAATGIELEYMIVDAATLDVRPWSDALLTAAAGTCVSDHERGPFCWSNELVLHVIELKTNGPAPVLDGVARGFQTEVNAINELLRPMGARLLPTAMHPWMDPHRETRLWPHDYSPVYQAYNRIFNCQGHGWSNLQSTHLNLPFANDDEFARLHAASRAVLPLLPALAASSPVADGRLAGSLDHRLAVYRVNSSRIPSITGRVIPEPVYSQADYEQHLLQPMYRDIAPLDPEGVLQDEFLNARGAIARFGRGSLELRLLDIQECPTADLAIARLVIATLRALTEERWTDLNRLKQLDTACLEALFLDVVREAEAARIDDPALRAVFGWAPGATPARAGALWSWLAEELEVGRSMEAAERAALAVILEHGTLASRMVRALGGVASRDRLSIVYGQLADCLAQGSSFSPPPSRAVFRHGVRAVRPGPRLR
jgi:glutamate---cysteine ligase / carboxylate-amine ligase